ncbi:hypothetical protein BDV37DRAFT_289378 [Aspergillus pseudonomiae]|uniref:BHLH domain-containing protein n=1 Tax=Aspergillus pseudonomiae TaxID=1506151 RepID=A0A5N7CTJ7_9EURO|nr:uncharacterized protein BDV37DRAFT_289378 [Aspergillus pseudonomiae]KAE8397490.1 hypothetical protein BDV37DRAFT_289378 [Aspergillus pseudonomiae]
MEFYPTESITQVDQNDEWSMEYPLLTCGNWSGSGLTPSDSNWAASTTELQNTDFPHIEYFSVDMAEKVFYDSYIPFRAQVEEPLKPVIEDSVITDTSQQSKPKLLRRSLTPMANSEPPSAPSIGPKPVPKQLLSQDTSVQQTCRSTHFGKKDDPTIHILQKRRHNQVEKRYRENLDARFKQLDNAIRQGTAAAGSDAKSAKGRRPGRKALILQNAYDHIVGLQTKLQTLQTKIEALRC